MSTSDSWSTIAIPLVTAALTLAGTSWQSREQMMQQERTRFLDGAQSTAQEAGQLLDEGYQALAKLRSATGQQGWQELYAGAWREYMDFHRRWRRQVIAEHFKLTRYFGKDLADRFVHVDEIDLTPVAKQVISRPCEVAGDQDSFDIVKLAGQMECFTRQIGALNDVAAEAAGRHDFQAYMDINEDLRSYADVSSKILNQYDRASVGYLRELSRRLTEMGSPVVTVVKKP